MLKRFFLCAGILFCLSAHLSVAQQFGALTGIVRDSVNNPLPGVTIVIRQTVKGTITDANGKYSLRLQPGTYTVSVSSIGFKTTAYTFTIKAGETLTKNFSLHAESSILPPVTIEDNLTRITPSTIVIDPKDIAFIPAPLGGVEKTMKFMPGVVSNSEFTNQYSVRGGNYDENLIYVNDIEVYRPFLIRAGQQEGLGFVNTDLVGSLSFSTGGFQPKYGDKMSSVLDIEYKTPDTLAGSVQAGILGGSVHLENASRNKKFTFIIGLREALTTYLLKGLDTKGEYKPSFTDGQSWIEYKFSKKFSLGMLNTYARNFYNVIPEARKVNFGTINQPYQLDIYQFYGQEVDKYSTFLNGIVAAYRPSPFVKFKWIASVFHTREQEFFDIEAYYRLCVINPNLGEEDFGDCVGIVGLGDYFIHARNELKTTVWNTEIKSYIFPKENSRHYIQAGIKFQHESIEDNLWEWSFLDSLVYVQFQELLRSDTTLQSFRVMGYVQNTWSITQRSTFTFGLRSHYWSLNGETTLSPRLQYSYKPNWKTRDSAARDVVFRFAVGFYHQPPFYRELRNLKAELNPDVQAQTSVHFVAGWDYNFSIWNRPFKFFTEAYYKYLYNLVPYDVDNVRIRYWGDNLAAGYAAGIDMRINGEFVRGVESWANLSMLTTQENIKGDTMSYIRRPTDQRFTFSMYFQDYIPGHPKNKVHLGFIYGTGFPTSPPSNSQEDPLTKTTYRNQISLPAYFRVDIGASQLIVFKEERWLKSIWLSLEVFNLFQRTNTVSYFWVRGFAPIDGQYKYVQFAVSNYLTDRMVNLRAIVRF